MLLMEGGWEISSCCCRPNVSVLLRGGGFLPPSTQTSGRMGVVYHL